MTTTLSQKDVLLILEEAEVFWKANEENASQEDWIALDKILHIANYEHVLNEEVWRRLIVRMGGYMVRSVHFDIHVNCITHFYPHEYTELFDELGKNPLIPFWMEEQEKSFEDLARMATVARAEWIFKELFFAMMGDKFVKNNQKMTKPLVEMLHVIGKKCSDIGLIRMANHLEYATVNKNVSKFYLDTMSYVSSLSTPSIRRYLPFWISLDRVIEEILKMRKINNKHPGLFAIMHSSETP